MSSDTDGNLVLRDEGCGTTTFRDGLLVSGKTLSGKIPGGMTLQDRRTTDQGDPTRVPLPRDVGWRGDLPRGTVDAESGARRSVLTATAPASNYPTTRGAAANAPRPADGGHRSRVRHARCLTDESRRRPGRGGARRRRACSRRTWPLSADPPGDRGLPADRRRDPPEPGQGPLRRYRALAQAPIDPGDHEQHCCRNDTVNRCTSHSCITARVGSLTRNDHEVGGASRVGDVGVVVRERMPGATPGRATV